MKYFDNPPEKSWVDLVKRPSLESDFLESSVRNIFNRVKSSGDAALRELTRQFDGAEIDMIEIQEDEINRAIAGLDNSLKDAIRIAASNISRFHAAQIPATIEVETMKGITCWRKFVPIDQVGIYIPGGTAPLFSTVLMLGIPAGLAGCREAILCSPPDQKGNVHPAILYAASLTGIRKIYRIGGAQAIAAMAYGTETIAPVAKIFGPGNQFVTQAKKQVSLEGIAIDLPAGPSEVLVIADESADDIHVAADLLSQAEHGPDSQVVLLCTQESKIKSIQKALDNQLRDLPRKETARQALENSFAVRFDTEENLAKFVNAYAPEHLIINTKNCDSLSERITNAGSIFLGPFSPEAVGDYASGTNHTLPTNGYARTYSGVSVESFMKSITVQKLSLEGLKAIGPAVETMAQAENLEGHRRAISLRLGNSNQ